MARLQTPDQSLQRETMKLMARDPNLRWRRTSGSDTSYKDVILDLMIYGKPDLIRQQARDLGSQYSFALDPNVSSALFLLALSDSTAVTRYAALDSIEKIIKNPSPHHLDKVEAVYLDDPDTRNRSRAYELLKNRHPKYRWDNVTDNEHFKKAKDGAKHIGAFAKEMLISPFNFFREKLNR